VVHQRQARRGREQEPGERRARRRVERALGVGGDVVLAVRGDDAEDRRGRRPGQQRAARAADGARGEGEARHGAEGDRGEGPDPPIPAQDVAAGQALFFWCVCVRGGGGGR